MNPRHQRAATILTAVMVLTSSAVGKHSAVAAFADNTIEATSTFGAAPDWVAPAVGSTTIAKTPGYLAGAIKQGGTYYVYANVTDTGNPASGIAGSGEKANVTAITATGAAVTLVPGTYSVGGTPYTHRSVELAAANPLSAGNKEYSVSSLDVAGNSRTQTGYTVTVDNLPPTASNIQTTNVGGGTAGRAQPGDTIVFTFSEQIDPESILSGWTGASTNVVVRLIDGGCTLIFCSDDSVTIWNATDGAQLPFGSVNLNRSDYYGGGLLGAQPPLRFGASGTPSTMIKEGATITITLGTGSATAETANGSATMNWTPSASAYDIAGNPTAGDSASESGTADKEF